MFPSGLRDQTIKIDPLKGAYKLAMFPQNRFIALNLLTIYCPKIV
jgi:hypothetical protein